MGKALFYSCLLVVLFSSCAQREDDLVAIADPIMVPSETPPPEQPPTVFKAGGWNITSLKGSVANKRIQMKDSPRLFVTKYVPAYKKRKLPILLESYFTEDERRKIGLFQGDLVISNMWVFDIAGKEFCYVLTVYPAGIPANIRLHFYDLDGDGRFETAKTATKLSPELWPDAPS